MKDTAVRTTSRVAAASLTAVVALTLAACSGGTEPAASPSDDGASAGPVVADLTVGYSPALPYAALELGSEEGIFEDHGLTVTLEQTPNGADAIPLLLQGSMQFTRLDIATAVNAVQQGLDVVIVAPVTVGQGDEKGFTGIVVNPDLGMTDAADLEGKNVQVNALGGTAQLLVSATVAEAGGDPEKVNFVELGTQEALPALQQGSVDAIATVEPFQTAAEGAGFQYLANPELVIVGVPTFVYVTTQAYADENPEIVQQFVDALLETFAFSNDNHDLVAQTAVEQLEMDPALADQLTMPVWGEEPPTVDQIQQYLDLLVNYGGVDEATLPDPASLLWSGQ